MHSYLDLLRDVLLDGELRPNRTGLVTQSVFAAHWRHDLRKGFPLLTTKAVDLHAIFYELRWMLLGETDAQWLDEVGVASWRAVATPEMCAKFGRRPGDLGPVYGQQLRRWNSAEQEGGHDQLAALLVSLASDPRGCRHVVTYWNPQDVELVERPPAALTWHVYVHGSGELSLQLALRSADALGEAPMHIATYALLLTLLGAATARPVRFLSISFTDLYLYETNLDEAQEQTGRAPQELPRLKINGRLAGRGLTAILDCQWCDVELVDANVEVAV